MHTKDEVADVAVALNTVQRSALDLAVEQAALRRNLADSFVNLGRRNQNLLDRQLDFISDLERDEQDPEHLEDLFKLDHLATRMRRNAESLLRLAGGGDTTQNAWGGPIPIGDVVRSAMGEIENFQRVESRPWTTRIVAASVGSDLSHAIAELVENALSFSADDETVGIRGRQDGLGLRPGHRRPRRRHDAPNSSPWPTGASPVRSPTPWRRPGTWATTSPGTSPTCTA